VPRPQIVFPPDATEVELGLDDDTSAALALKVRDGAPPFTWYVDGAPVLLHAMRREAAWRPREPGFIDISVVDSNGAAARTRVLVK
ncbi:MAG: penicillin-binding protein 1C, partial [Rhizobiaceae bacterium]|nr:penicillin-binding protein 1C [Rhizobiaceae bacterium]